jgi:hypothetical protein
MSVTLFLGWAVVALFGLVLVIWSKVEDLQRDVRRLKEYAILRVDPQSPKNARP